MYTHCNLHGYHFKNPKLQREFIEKVDFGPNIQKIQIIDPLLNT